MCIRIRVCFWLHAVLTRVHTEEPGKISLFTIAPQRVSREVFFFFLSFFFFEQFQLELIVVARTTNITSVFTVCKATDSGAVRA